MLLIVGSFKKMTTFATANEKDWFLGCRNNGGNRKVGGR